MKLTNTACMSAKPKEKPYKMADGGGMFLEITPNGGKLWRLKYRFWGKEKLLSLGKYPQTTLAEARAKRDELKKILSNGIDPSEHRKREKEDIALNSQNTFESVAREWHGKNLAKWRDKHGQDILTRLEKDIFPEIGGVPVRDLSPQRLLSAIRKMEERGAHELARRARGTCEQVLAYAIGTGRADRNVARDLRGTLEAFKRGHFPSLEIDRIPELLERLDTNEARLFPQTIRATKLLMLTFVRTSELINVTWDEIDLDKAVWNIPAKRMKMDRPHTVPLSTQAIELFKAQKEDTRIFNTPYVFPSQIEPRKPMSNGTILGGLKRMGYKGEMTGHGFRSLAMSTIKERLGYRHEVVDNQLAHAKKSKNDAAYDRAQFIADRIKMMQDWADYLDGVKKGQ